MVRKRTKAQKLADCYDAFKCIKEGKPVKRQGTKDGSIATHPVVPVSPHKFEHMILADCLKWLKKHNILCNQHDAGTFQNTRGQWGTYGIKGAGDIIGLLPTGQHFEIEVKRGSRGRLSLGQQKRMRQIRENNGLYFVVHGLEELEYYFEGLL